MATSCLAASKMTSRTSLGRSIVLACQSDVLLRPVTITQARSIHNPKWMREEAKAAKIQENIRSQLLAGTFRSQPFKVRDRVRQKKRSTVPLVPVIEDNAVPLTINKKIESWVYNLNAEKVGILDLNPEVFDTEIRRDLIHRVVVWQRAKKRQGTHKVKGRSEVRGTTKKPFPQKGTGRARASCLRTPLHYKGGRALPKRPRDYSFHMPRQIRQRAMKIALSAKRQEQCLHLLDAAVCESHKTKELNNKLKLFSDQKTLIIHGNYEVS